MNKMHKNLLPEDIDTSDHFWDSFKFEEFENVVRNFVSFQQKISPKIWKPISFTEYQTNFQNIFNRPVRDFVKEYFETLVNGGNLHANYFESGYFTKDENEIYYVTEKFLKTISKFAFK